MKHLNSIITNCIAAFVVSLLVVSCSSTKKTVPAASRSVAATSAGEVGSPESNFKAMIESYAPDWQKLKMPVSATIASPVSISASGTVTMWRGRLLTISMRFMGMEIAALYLTPDSVTVLDRWNKRYLSEDLSGFLAGFPVDITNVQDLLTGRVFIAGNSSPAALDAGNFKFESEGDYWGCQPLAEDDRFGYAFICMARTLVGLQVSAGSGGAEVSYGEPVATLHGPVASSTHVVTTAAKKRIDVRLDWKPSKIAWDDDVSVPSVSIPRGYARVDASSVIKSLSSGKF